MAEVLYELKQKFNYACKGNQETATFIQLLPPSAKNIANTGALKQAFFRAARESAGDVEDVEAAKEDAKGAEMPTGEEIMELITASSQDLSIVFAHGKELLTSGLALIEGEEKLTKPLWDSMSIDDIESMLGEYIVNFILASSLMRQNKA